MLKSMSGILSFPFRLDPTGRAATVQPGSDAETDEAIAVLVLTMLGERPMSPQYGIPDPAFAGLALSDIQVGLDQFGPQNIRVNAVNITPRTETKSDAEILWSRKGEETEGLI